MPSPYVKKLSDETGKSIEEIEELWSKAKKIASEHFNMPEIDFTSNEYKYVTGIVKNMLGKNESFENPDLFLNSSLSAEEFIEEELRSGSFTNIITKKNVIIPPEKDEIEEPEEDKLVKKDDEKKEEVQEEYKIKCKKPDNPKEIVNPVNVKDLIENPKKESHIKIRDGWV